MGKVAGDKFKVTLQPEDAFGVHDDNLIQTFERSSLQSSEEIRVGVQIDVHLSGEHRWVIVTKVDGDQITVDGNHPLADETLTFEGEVVEVREPTGEELTHGGHVHGPGGHH